LNDGDHYNDDDDEGDLVILWSDGSAARFSRQQPVKVQEKEEENEDLRAEEGPNVASSSSSGKARWLSRLDQAVSQQQGSDESEENVVDSRAPRVGKHIASAPYGLWFQLSLLESNMTAVALSRTGAIVSVELNTGSAELVGEFENGILAASWSPDKEILALITVVYDDDDNQEEDGGNNDKEEDNTKRRRKQRRFVLLAMTAEWDVLSETDLEECDASADFTVCWRPDSSLFAVSSVDVVDQQRKIRIYRRDPLLELYALGRNEDGSGTLAPNLLPPLSWAGPGCSLLLATVQRKGKSKQQIAFLEPNGLRHGQLVLAGGAQGETQVRQLAWNATSDLLAVCLRDQHHHHSGAAHSTDRDRVQLWHRSNYHWYLKQEIRVHDKIQLVRFSNDSPHSLFVVEASSRCREYRFQWDPSTVGNDTDATAWVVDGNELQVTRFGSAIVPPPLFEASVVLGDSTSPTVSHLALGNQKRDGFVTVAVHSDGTFSWVESLADTNSSSSGSYRVTRVAAWLDEAGDDRLDDPALLRCHCIVHIDDAISDQEVTLLAVAPSHTKYETLVTISLRKNRIQVVNRFPVHGRVLALTAWSDSSEGALIQLENGSLLEFEYPSMIMPSPAEPLMEPCPWIAALENVSGIDDGQHFQRTRLVVGLSQRGRLYCHELLLADSASSFFLSPAHEYLCFATAGSQCQLCFVSLAELHSFDPFLGPEESRIISEGYEPRNVERGAKVVVVLPKKPAVVVQMPRGNLELVHPRALVLRQSVHLIDKGEYSAAFALLRRHRVDLNLIVDLDPTEFLDGGRAELFLEHISSIDHLNLFISSLQNDDSTKERILVPEWWRRDVKHTAKVTVGQFDATTKVNRTCEALRLLMMTAEERGTTLGRKTIREGHFLLPILSTFAKQNPPQLEDALLMIKQNAVSRHPSFSVKSALFSDSAQSSIQYLAFLAEYELLFETALGMYDFDLARAVARNSQMDPKLYLPLLKRYRELPENFARFEVDVRLKRFESALRHLHQSCQVGEVLESLNSSTHNSYRTNDFDACARLIEEHRLFRLGMELFRDESHRSAIILSLGDYLLRDANDPTAALSVFLSCYPNVDLERAKRAARQCRDWKTFFSISGVNRRESLTSDPLEIQQRSLLAREVANELTAGVESDANRRQMYSDAARVLLDYGTEHELSTAVDTLLQGEQWIEAKRISQLHDRQDLARKVVDAAVHYARTTLVDLAERRASFCATLEQYSQSLKLRKESSVGAGGEGQGPIDADEEADDAGSLFSLASHASSISMASATSTGSSTSSVTSSVISVKSTTTFSLAGNDESNRHKSKFNSAGDRRTKPKKKKVRKGRSKAFPGSDQELRGYLQTLRSCCVEESYRCAVEETVTFLMRNDLTNLALDLYTEYAEFCRAIDKAQGDRRAREDDERLLAEKEARKVGHAGRPPLVLSVEKDVDALRSAPFSDSLNRLFSFFPTSFV
jgi:elongator complex protein 1